MLRPTMRLAATAVIVAATCGGRAVRAGTPSAFKPSGPLAGLPSAPGPHVARIKALGDDSWLVLGSPAPDPKWGKARGRAWTPRMPYAPELRAAFLCGCGVHGHVKPDGHFMDDLWAVDIHAHRWICVYPGADTKTLKLKLDRYGFEVNDRGDHVPVSYLSHGYCNLAYAPDFHKLMIIYTQSPWWTRALPQRWTWLDQSFENVRRRNYGHVGPVIENTRHPLFYDVARGKWERKLVAGKGPGPRRFEGVLEYIPSRKQAFFLYRGRVWFYDFAANEWSASSAKAVPIAYDSWGCYDSRRQRVYVARKQGFWAYDLRANTWNTIQGKGQPDDLGSCARGALTYDPVGDAVLFHFSRGAGIRIYSPATNAWSQAASPPKLDWRYRQMNGFYAPALNAHYYHLAGDSRDDGILVVYRYRSAHDATRQGRHSSDAAGGPAILEPRHSQGTQ